jgi:hypothetical protein
MSSTSNKQVAQVSQGTMQSDSQKAMTMEGHSSSIAGGGGKAAGESVEGETKLREFLKESMIRNVL